jgi:peptidoglycan/xylan/chitin deacetylase (PgdA/CDA1 family)
MAWTVDDGASQSSLAAYLKLLENHEQLRMTMFVLESSRAWRNLAKPISELAATGRLQLGNHTRTHPDLTRASSAKIKSELTSCGKFIEDTFGVSAGTYFRPPYGYIDERVIRVAREVGYTTPTLWLGSTGAGSVTSSAEDWRLCQKWMTNGRIVIDHANSKVTVNNFSKIINLLENRKLKTVTLQDVFGSGWH